MIIYAYVRIECSHCFLIINPRLNLQPLLSRRLLVSAHDRNHKQMPPTLLYASSMEPGENVYILNKKKKRLSIQREMWSEGKLPEAIVWNWLNQHKSHMWKFVTKYVYTCYHIIRKTTAKFRGCNHWLWRTTNNSYFNNIGKVTLLVYGYDNNYL